MTIFDITGLPLVPGAGFVSYLENAQRPFMIEASSYDELNSVPSGIGDLGTAQDWIIGPMTPFAPYTGGGGKYRPIRMALSTGGCTTGQAVINMTDTAPFRVGQVVSVVAQATPLGAALAVGTILSISAGVSITLVANASNAVSSGDIIIVTETDPLTTGALAHNDTLLLNGLAFAMNTLIATRIDVPGKGLNTGICWKSAIRMNLSKGITIARLAGMMPQLTMWNAVAGVNG